MEFLNGSNEPATLRQDPALQLMPDCRTVSSGIPAKAELDASTWWFREVPAVSASPMLSQTSNSQVPIIPSKPSCSSGFGPAKVPAGTQFAVQPQFAIQRSNPNSDTAFTVLRSFSKLAPVLLLPDTVAPQLYVPGRDTAGL